MGHRVDDDLLLLTLTSQVMGSVTSWMAVIRRQPARNSPVVS